MAPSSRGPEGPELREYCPDTVQYQPRKDAIEGLRISHASFPLLGLEPGRRSSSGVWEAISMTSVMIRNYLGQTLPQYHHGLGKCM